MLKSSFDTRAWVKFWYHPLYMVIPAPTLTEIFLVDLAKDQAARFEGIFTWGHVLGVGVVYRL